RITRALLDFRNHIWVLLRVTFLIIFYSFVQSELAETILSYDLWLKIPLWGLLFIWVIKAMRQRKISIFFTGLIIWGVPLFWAYAFFPISLFINGGIRGAVKVILWLTVIFWFPLQFLNVIKDHRANQVIILSVIWAGVLSLFSYGIGKGILVAVLLLIMPISRLLNAPKTEQRNLSSTLDKRLYIPTAISLLFVALLVTREGLWLIGAFIWIVFSVTVSHSSRYFRRTYDLIEELYPNPQGRRRRHFLLFISLSLTTLILFPGVLGKLSNEFVVNHYSQASGLAFGLITILLAVQAIIPGVTTWAGNTRKAHHLREMRSILRANAGLEGFMQWFFILFIYSLIAWLISALFLTNVEILVDLSKASAFEQPIYALGEIRSLFFSSQKFSEELLTRLSTVIFAVFSYVTIYGIAQLYYLFIAANTLTLPIRDSLLSSPVEIKVINFEVLQNKKDQNRKENEIRLKLRSDQELNGHIINLLNVSYDPGNPEQIDKVKVEFELDFIELRELHKLVNRVFLSIFELGQVANVEVSIVRRTYQKFRRQPVFHLEINLNEWEFLKKDVLGFPFNYKLQCLGARQPDYVLAESQIA
nr:hypothetical protein [Candidatus Brocadiales bacterium]